MRKNSPSKNSKIVIIKKYQSPSEFVNSSPPVVVNRQRSNLKNYFYAQKHRSMQRPTTSTDDNHQSKRKSIKREYSAKTRNSCQIPIIGIIKPFFTNFQQSQKIVSTKALALENANSTDQSKNSHINTVEDSIKSMHQRKSQNYQKIISDVSQYFNSNKVSAYVKYGFKQKKKERRANKKKQQLPIQQIIYECVYHPDENLNIKGLKPNIFWSEPKSATRDLKQRRQSRKLMTEEMLKRESPDAIIKYNSNFISSKPTILQQKTSPEKKSAVAISRSTKIIPPKKRPIIDYLGKVKPQMNFDELQLLKIMYYKDIIWKVWFNSSHKVIPPNSSPKYFVGKGNNSKLIKSIMGKRWWWKLDSREDNANFLWTQLKIYSVYQEQACLQPYSQFQKEQSSQLWNTEKIQSLHEKNSVLLTKQKFLRWKQYLTMNKRQQSKSSQLLQSRKVLEREFKISSEFPKKVSNHLQFSRMIGNKKALYKTMTLYYSLFDKTNRFLPVTYHITSGLQDEEYLRFLNEYYFRSKNLNKTSWIVKPGQMSNRGNGIVVCKDVNEIKAIIKKKKCHNNGKPFTYIIQEYLDRPFLYQGRKFDLRHYIMITSSYGRIQGYFYEDGYIRTTSYKYSTDNQKSSVHLTNDAVQKYCKDYGKYQQGNKLSYDEFEQYLQTKYSGKYSFYKTILPKIRQISIQLINSCYFLIDPKRRQHNFEIFGLDIMIDQDFKPWLIQANTNPCLELSSKILAKIIPRMLDNAFMIALDPLFPPPPDISNKRISLPENCVEQNKFELIFDQAVDGQALNKAYRESDKGLGIFDGCASDEQAYESAQDDCDIDY